LNAISSWSPQSHLFEPKVSPVRHCECTLTSTLSLPLTSPFIKATCISLSISDLYVIVLKSPHFVGKIISEAFSINFSVLFLYFMSSSMANIFKLYFSESILRSSSLATSPSSLKTSHMIPTGSIPAIFSTSIAASVWPALLSIPPGFELTGKICPGIVKSSGFAFFEMKVFIVFSFSFTEIPLPLLEAAFIDKAKEAALLAFLPGKYSAISGIFKSSSFFSSHGR